jgi:hypothetical protein
MFVFRLVFGLLLVAGLLCFAAYVATGNPLWRRRGLVTIKWTLLAALGARRCWCWRLLPCAARAAQPGLGQAAQKALHARPGHGQQFEGRGLARPVVHQPVDHREQGRGLGAAVQAGGQQAWRMACRSRRSISAM